MRINNHWLFEIEPDETLEFNCCMCDKPMEKDTSYCSFSCMDADNPLEQRLRDEL